MNASPYSLNAWRRLKEGRDNSSPKRPAQCLADVPTDAEMDDGIVLGCWNGERFVSWEKWLATAPIERDPQQAPSPVLADAKCLSATCGNTRVWLVRDGDRWQMFAGTRTARRRDFASPFLSHAQRTAEVWYGAAEEGWHIEAQG
jgi:hypothetical protein